MSLNNLNSYVDYEEWEDYQDSLEERDELGKGVKKSKRNMAVVQDCKEQSKIDRTSCRGKMWTIIGDE